MARRYKRVDWGAVNGAICEALGLDAANVSALSIVLRPVAAPLVTVEFLDTNLSELASTFERSFTLCPVEEDAG